MQPMAGRGKSSGRHKRGTRQPTPSMPLICISFSIALALGHTLPLTRPLSLPFIHLQGVTGELYGSTSATLQDLVLYNLAPGGALPYGGGFAVPGSDLYRKLLLYGSSNWNATVNETTGEPNPLPALGSVAYEDTLANLTLPLWYFARPANSDNGLMSLYRVVLVVPTAELQLWLYLLAQVRACG